MSKKVKLYIYSSARKHVHDSMKMYINTVPLSKLGIKKYFEVVEDPLEADYFYMGQIPNEHFRLYSPKHFEHFQGNEHKHICDIEGEGGMPIPGWLHNSIITTMGPLKLYSNIDKLFTRPTFSHLLLDIIKNRNEEFEFPNNNKFGFRGYMNHGCRAMMVYALHTSPELGKELHINRVWAGPSEIGSKVQQEYIDTMLANGLSLCPRGSGIDSVRLLESCYYNRVPILISDLDYYMVGEDQYDTSFVFRICDEKITPKKVADKLKEVYDLPLEDLKERADAARKYFDDVIRVYFEDPTKFFLEWLEKKNEGS